MISPRTRLAATTFTRNLRFEFAGEEGRALWGSYAVSLSLGLLWLLAVWFLPATPEPKLADLEEPVVVRVSDSTSAANTPPIEEAAAPARGDMPAHAASKKPASRGTGAGPSRPAVDAGSAFGGSGSGAQSGGLVGDVAGALRGVDLAAAGSGGAPGRQGKAVLASGGGGQGSRTPGRGNFGDGGLGGNVGAVAASGPGGGAGVGLSRVSISAPRPVASPGIPGPARELSDLGTYVRNHQSQLQFCYEEAGLKKNPNLAGVLEVAVSIAGDGSVTGADVTRRSWSGAGAADAEACIKNRIMGWRLSPSSKGAGTYSFPFSFTR